MTQEYLSKKIKTIEEALNFANDELIMLLDNNEVEKVRSQIIKREDILDELNEINLILLVTDDNPEKLDVLIKLIRSSADEEEAIKKLMEKYSITDIQAETMTNLSIQELDEKNHKEKRSMYLDELHSIEKELNENVLYTSLEEKDIAFLIKSLELKMSLLEFFS